METLEPPSSLTKSLCATEVEVLLTTNGHQWTRIDPSNSCSFAFIRGFFLILCGCGYAESSGQTN